MTPVADKASISGLQMTKSPDFVIRPAWRSYIPAFVMVLIPISAGVMMLTAHVLRHGWVNMPWQTIVVLGLASFFGIGIIIGLHAYQIRLSVDKVVYITNPFGKVSTVIIEDVVAVYIGHRNGRPIVKIVSRKGMDADMLIDTFPFEDRDIRLFLEKLLSLMPEGGYVGKMKCDALRRRKSHRRKAHNRNTLWLALLLFVGVLSAVAFVSAAKFQRGPVGAVQFVLMAGGFLMSYTVYSMVFDYKYIMKAVGGRPRRWHGMVLFFLTCVPSQLLFVLLPVLLIQTAYRRYMPYAALVGWVFGVVATKSAVRHVLEKVCSRLFRLGKRGVK